MDASHPAVCNVKEWVAFQIAKGRYNPRMVGNFDQVWCLNYRPKKSILSKFEVRDELSRQPANRKLRHLMERALQRPFTETLEQKSHAEERLTRLQGGSASHTPPDLFRVPHTLTTLSWRDGCVGRGFITIRDDAMSNKCREQLNQELSGPRPYEILLAQ